MRALVLLAVVVLAGCGVGPAGEIEDGARSVTPPPWVAIEPGMKAVEVESRVGAPCQVLSKTWDPAEIWVYRSDACASEVAWCVFMDAGVVDHVTPYCQNG